MSFLVIAEKTHGKVTNDITLFKSRLRSIVDDSLIALENAQPKVLWALAKCRVTGFR
jgi:hypothetical protein